LKIISRESIAESLIISKSKFIGLSFIVKSKEEALKKIQQSFGMHPSCSHIAFSYQIYKSNVIEPYFTDNGEPAGTAGKPLLSILENKKIINTCLAVVRYYGGVNLGTGGLARAYSKAGMLALNQSDITNYIEKKNYLFTLKYNMLDIISNVIYKNNGEIIDKKFSDDICLKVALTSKVATRIQSQYPLIKINETPH